MATKSKKIPKELMLLGDYEQYKDCMREDGLRVFFDKHTDPLSNFLNDIRLRETKPVVITSIGIIRGFQIAMGCARKYAPECLPEVKAFFLKNPLKNLN
jgi:hypothetical protein